jgi:hypothetical protein
VTHYDIIEIGGKRFVTVSVLSQTQTAQENNSTLGNGTQPAADSDR